MILVKGGNVDLLLDSGHTLVLPSSYGLIHDTDGRHLDKCSLFIGPTTFTDEAVSRIDDDARAYFGSDYEPRRAVIDVPEGKWDLYGHVAEIIYYRPGRLEGDWVHPFSTPQPLYEQAGWFWLRLPDDCRLTHRGIEQP